MTRHRHRYERCLTPFVTFALAVLVAVPVAAHTEVQRAVPGPAETVGGTVDEIEITFLDPILDGAEVDVVGPEGASVAGLGEPALDTAGRVLRVGFDALTEPGDYVVRLSFVAADGDGQSENYRFTFDPDAAAGRGRWLLGGGAVAGAALAIAVAVARRRRTSSP